MKNKPITSVILGGKPKIGILFLMAKGLMDSFDLLLREYERLPWPNPGGYHKTDDIDIKRMGVIMNKNMILPFVCELSLTALYLLDHPTANSVPKKHSLLYWWQKLKTDTKEKITKQFKEARREKQEIEKKSPEKILKQNDKSHTEWRYWWRRGFATGAPSSTAMPHLTKILINLVESYLKERGDRELPLPEGIEGIKAYYKARKEREAF